MKKIKLLEVQSKSKKKKDAKKNNATVAEKLDYIIELLEGGVNNG